MMRPITITSSVVILLLALPMDLIAQETSAVVPGARVRVTAPEAYSSRIIGTVLSINADTLMLSKKELHAPLAISLDSMTRLELSLGRGRSLKKGLKVGAFSLLAGAGAGYIGALATDDLHPLAYGAIGAGIGGLDGFLIGASGKHATYGFLSGAVIGLVIGAAARSGDISTGGSALGGAAILGEIGMITGGIARIVLDADRWEQVPLERVRMGVLPQSEKGIALSASLAF